MEPGPPIDIPLRAYAALATKRPLRALLVGWWWITGRRVRARNRLDAAVAELAESYDIWLMLRQAKLKDDGAPRPRVAVHIHVGPSQSLEAKSSIQSVLDQLASGDVLYVTTSEPGPAVSDTSSCHAFAGTFASRGDALRHVLSLVEADHLMPLGAGTCLAPGAIDGLARTIGLAENPDAVFYCDQDEISDRRRRSNPWLKPAWDPDLFLSQDYLSTACVLPVRTARSTAIECSWRDDCVIYALLLKMTSGLNPVPVQHIPLVAVTTPPGTWSRSSPERLEVVRAHTGISVSSGPFGTLILESPVPEPEPLVSIIVPTRDRLDLLETCVRGVLEQTDYPNLELIIADNGSVEARTLAFLNASCSDPRVRVVRWPHAYNYSAINNFAATSARGEYLCLLNNDTEIVASDWLTRMVAQAVRPHVGAVGARLLYADRSIQHAGVVIGLGNAAGHAHRGLEEGGPGYFAQALVTREATAVTAACLVISRDKFQAVGGLDEKELAIAYNDIDLCLKLRQAGWRNVYCAQAVLIHHESKSRGMDFAPEHLARYMKELAVFQERWGTVGYQDPTHHPWLDAASEIYRLKM